MPQQKGVSILLSKHTTFSTEHQLVDPEGRYIFLKGNIDGKPVQLANVYFPNKSHITFCQLIIDELKSFAEGCILLGGDFNIPLNPIQDASSGKSCIAYRILTKIKKLLKSMTLIDTWRTLHPTRKDYTFYSAPHKHYTRIDHIFITQRDPIDLDKAEIGNINILDHAPISITLKTSINCPQKFCWRLNASLLVDPNIQSQIQNSLTNYFQTNNTPDISPLTIWEAHKSVIRGELIKWDSWKKKEREKNINDLVLKITNLELIHKHSQAQQMDQELTQTRKTLQNLLDSKAKRSLFLRRLIYYEHGDKGGKLLARALKGAKLANNIHGVRSEDSNMK